MIPSWAAALALGRATGQQDAVLLKGPQRSSFAYRYSGVQKPTISISACGRRHGGRQNPAEHLLFLMQDLAFADQPPALAFLVAPLGGKGLFQRGIELPGAGRWLLSPSADREVEAHVPAPPGADHACIRQARQASSAGRKRAIATP